MIAGLVRGCGTRALTSVYWTLGFAKEGGVPLETFLCDPPILTESFLAGLELPKVGVKVIERDGVVHLIDRVGTTHYPTVPHLIEEARHYGFSRRLSSGLPFEKLTSKSRLLLVHDLASIGNSREVAPWSYPDKPHGCPKGRHTPEDWPICLGACWSALPAHMGTPLVQQPHLVEGDFDSRAVVVTTKSTAFRGRRLPPGYTLWPDQPGMEPPDGPLVRVKPAIFASIPCGALEVIRAPEDAHQTNVEKASKSPFPVIVCDE